METIKSESESSFRHNENWKGTYLHLPIITIKVYVCYFAKLNFIGPYVLFLIFISMGGWHIRIVSYSCNYK
jgi:hypothetical protein